MRIQTQEYFWKFYDTANNMIVNNFTEKLVIKKYFAHATFRIVIKKGY